MSPVRTTPGTASRRLGVALLLAFVALVLAAPASVASAPAAAERTSAWVRAAHLSPGTGPVDVWLTPFGGVPGAATLTHVPYGAVSPYLPVAAGVYTVAMRPAGSPVSAPAVLTGVVRVQGGKAYSVLATGKQQAVDLNLVPDDLTPPPPGKGRVRIVEASTKAPAFDVAAVGGPVLVRSLAYGAVGPYTTVPEGRWPLRITASDGGAVAATASLDVRPGAVVTVFVLNSPTSVVTLKPVVDAAGPSAMPAGAVNAGGGGLAEPGRTSSPARAVVAALAGLLAGALVLGRRALARTRAEVDGRP